MPVVEPSPIEDREPMKELSAAKKKKKKREREPEEGKCKPDSNFQEHLEVETGGAVSRNEDPETERRLAKKRKVGKGGLPGDDDPSVGLGFDGNFGSDHGKNTSDLNAVDDKEKWKKEKKKTKKDAMKVKELGDGDFAMGEKSDGSVFRSEDETKLDKKRSKKNKKKTKKDAMELEETDKVGVEMGEENDGSLFESTDDRKLDKEKRKKKNKNAKKVTMVLEEQDNGAVVESEDCLVTLEEGKQLDMSKGEDKNREGKKKNKEGDNIGQDVGQNTLPGGDGKRDNKEREKSKDKNESGEKERAAQQKGKGKRVSFTDAVEVLGDGGDDEESDGLVHGKRFTREEDAKLMEAMLNYAEMKQLGENGLEIIRASVKHPNIRGCWAEIAKALPHRPPVAVYKRARILLYRSAARKWTEEEYEIIRRFVEKNGTNWTKLAADLGKSDIHVKDTWRRIKPKNLKKGAWSQDEYQNLFDLVNLDLRVKAHQQIDHGHRLIRENISWEAISDKLTTRSNKDCCLKWYRELASPLVKQGVWADTDDYQLVEALQKVDAVCLEDVNWDDLLAHRSGELCRQRWNQMVRMLGGHREKTFIEQVEVLSRRYSLEMLDYRKPEAFVPPATPSAEE